MAVREANSERGEVFRAALKWFYLRVVLLVFLSIVAVAGVVTSFGAVSRSVGPIVLGGCLVIAWYRVLQTPYEVRFTTEGVVFKSILSEAHVALSEIEEVEVGRAPGCTIRHRAGTIVLTRIFEPKLAAILSRIQSARMEV